MSDPRHFLDPGFFKQHIKPTGRFELDRSHPLSNGLELALAPNSQHGLRCKVHGDMPTVTGSPALIQRDGRQAVSLGGTSDVWYLDYASRGSFSTACTILCISRPDGAGNYFSSNDGAFFSNRNSGNNGLSYYHDTAVGGSPNPGRQSFVIQGVAAYTAAGLYLDGSDFQAHGLIATSGGSVSYMADGSEQDADAVASFTSSAADWRIGQFGSASGLPLYSDIDLLLVWKDRALSLDEYAELSRRPYQLFKPANDRVWVPVAAGGGTTHTITAAALSVSGQAFADIQAQNEILTAETLGLSGQSFIDSQGQTEEVTATALGTLTGQAFADIQAQTETLTSYSVSLTGEAFTDAQGQTEEVTVTALGALTGQALNVVAAQTEVVLAYSIETSGRVLTVIGSVTEPLRGKMLGGVRAMRGWVKY